jgi:hypothetical protein
MQPALDCEACGALTPGDRFRYFAEQLVCEACGDAHNPQARQRMVPRAWLQQRDICVNFITSKGYYVQAMDADHRTMLGPFVRVQDAGTLRRLLAYLGGTPGQLTEFDYALRACGQGTVSITLLIARTCCGCASDMGLAQIKRNALIRPKNRAIKIWRLTIRRTHLSNTTSRKMN